MRPHAHGERCLTFNEAFAGFGSGNQSSKSPASRRVSFLSFSNHRKRSETPSRRRSSDDSFETERTIPNDSQAGRFDRTTVVLLRSHFASIIRLLTHDGLIDPITEERLFAILNQPDWEARRVHAWMTHYTNYLRRRDLPDFIESLLFFN